MKDYFMKNKKYEDKVIGHCGVDSGNLLIIDPCYLKNGFDYQQVFDITDYGETKEGGFLIHTCGDGFYPIIGFHTVPNLYHRSRITHLGIHMDPWGLFDEFNRQEDMKTKK